MEVLVLGYGHNDQDVLQQADDAQSHKHFRGYKELLVAASWGVALCVGLAGPSVQSVTVVPEMERLDCPTMQGEIHLREIPFGFLLLKFLFLLHSFENLLWLFGLEKKKKNELGPRQAAVQNIDYCEKIRFQTQKNWFTLLQT